MANYFSFFPTTYYTSGANNATGLDVVTNIISRFGFAQSLKENTAAFYSYQIKESDTPEIIASKLYGSSERHWVVLMFNNIIDPQYDWPLQYDQLNSFIDKKYAANGAAEVPAVSGLQWAQNRAHVYAYYKVVIRKATYPNIDSKTITEKIQIDESAYTALPVTTTQYTLPDGTEVTETVTKETKTYYEYEFDLNESKREIKLLKPEYVRKVFEEFKEIIST